MKFDVVYPFAAPATLKIRLHKNPDTASCFFFYGPRLYLGLGVLPYIGSKTGQTAEWDVPVKVLNMHSCKIVNGVFWLTPASGKKKNSLRLTATIQEEGKSDRALDVVLAKW
jgi:hypothetical protein